MSGKASRGAGPLDRPRSTADLLETLEQRLEYCGKQLSRQGTATQFLSSFRVTLSRWVANLVQSRSLGISPLSAMQTRMRQNEDRYRQLVESANDAIYTTDSKGTFTFVNPAAARISGYSEQDLIGKYYLDLIHPDYEQQAKSLPL
jgi:PAS domain-containing protein